MTLGNRIAALRKTAGLSQEALASRLGVSRQAIGKWEADASLPGLDNLHQLAKELGVSIDALLAGEQNAKEAAPDGDDAPAKETEEACSTSFATTEDVTSLLEQQTQREHRRQRRMLAAAGIPAVLALLALAAGLVWQGGQLAGLRSQLALLQGNLATLDGSLNSLQSRLDTAVTGQGQSVSSESLAASWDIQTKEYSPAERRVMMALFATPSTITDDCAVRFTFVLSDGQSIVLDAERGDGDAFFAEGWVPLAESYTLNMSLTRDGETKVEQLYTEPAFASRYEMQLWDLPLVLQSASHVNFSKTLTLRQNAGDYDIPVEVYYSAEGRPYQWPVKAWVTATLEDEEVLNLPLDTDFMQPGGENSPGEPMGPVTFHLRFSLEAETFEVPWKAEYESGELPRLDYQLHILDNGDVESTYSLNP